MHGKLKMGEGACGGARWAPQARQLSFGGPSLPWNYTEWESACVTAIPAGRVLPRPCPRAPAWASLVILCSAPSADGC